MNQREVNKSRLYQFFNLEVDRRGVAFSLCDNHKKTYKVPANCIMEKIADSPVEPCNFCTHPHLVPGEEKE